MDGCSRKLQHSPKALIGLSFYSKAKTIADARRPSHALKGAIVSLAVMWRLPVLHARDPEDALRILRFLAQQVRDSEQRILRRYDRNPSASLRETLHASGPVRCGPSVGSTAVDQVWLGRTRRDADEEA